MKLLEDFAEQKYRLGNDENTQRFYLANFNIFVGVLLQYGLMVFCFSFISKILQNDNAPLKRRKFFGK